MSSGEPQIRLTSPRYSYPLLLAIPDDTHSAIAWVLFLCQVQCQGLFHGQWSHLILPRALLGRYSHHCFSDKETEVQRRSATCRGHRANGKQGFESWHLAPETVLLQSLRLGCSPDLNLGLASFAKHTLTAQPALTSPRYICLSLKGAVLAILQGSLHQGPALLLLSLPRPHGWTTGVRRPQKRKKNPALGASGTWTVSVWVRSI